MKVLYSKQITTVFLEPVTSGLAQRKRVGPIIQRTDERNIHPLKHTIY
jgi:hypothetical protein